MSRNLFSPLSLLNLEFYDKKNKELLLLKEANLLFPFKTIPYDPLKSLQSLFIAEILHKCLREELPDTELYSFLSHSIEYFDKMEKESANFHLSFLMKLTKFLGISPYKMDESNISGLDIEDGMFTSESAQSLAEIEKENAQYMYRLVQANYEEAGRIPLNRNKRNLLTKDILQYYDSKAYPLNKMNSFDILKDFFS